MLAFELQQQNIVQTRYQQVNTIEDGMNMLVSGNLSAIAAGAAVILDNPQFVNVALTSASSLFPGVPTFQSLGVEFDEDGYFGIIVNPATPDSICQQISQALYNVTTNPQFLNYSQSIGANQIFLPYNSAALSSFLSKRISIVTSYLQSITPPATTSAPARNYALLAVALAIPLVIACAIIITGFAILFYVYRKKPSRTRILGKKKSSGQSCLECFF